jgi:hypothetical protein
MQYVRKLMVRLGRRGNMMGEGRERERARRKVRRMDRKNKWGDQMEK